MKKARKTLVIAALALGMIVGLVTPGTAAERAPKNVIIMIADGVCYNQILAADYYLYGEAGTNPYEEFPVSLAMSTYSFGQSQGIEDDAESIYDAANWNDPIRFQFGATDSAAAATAMSTGTKTWDSAVGIDQNEKALTHLYQDFEKLGKATGVITSVPFDHATPAGFSAHHNNRDEYLVIADEMLKVSTLDVIMGCGHPLFDDFGIARETPKYKYISEETWAGLVDDSLPTADADGNGTADPWTLISAKADFEALQTGATPDRLIGIPEVATTLQEYRILYTPDADTVTPYAVPLIETVPTLDVMAKGALNVLDNDQDGFFLMIEGGAPDWAGHFSQTGSLIEEMADFYNAVDAVVKWVEKNSSWDETLVVVTGDHETGFLSGSPDGLTPVTGNGQGVVPNMYWSLGTRDKKWIDFGWHSNQLVPFFAKGAGAELFNAVADQNDPVRGKFLDNTEISAVIRELCGVTDTAWSDILTAMDLGLVPYGLENYANGMTREDFCLLTYQLLNKATGTKLQIANPDKPMPFTDVTNASYNVIYTLNQLGIIGGKSATKFAPDAPVTREEAAKVLSNSAQYLGIGLPNATSGFSDKGTISGWAQKSAADMNALGVMRATGNKFMPKRGLTGMDAINAMLRLYDLTV